MRFEDWVESLEGEERERFERLVERAESEGSGRGELSRELQSLFESSVVGEYQEHVGRIVGGFWREYGKPKESVIAARDSVECSTLTRHLPYPLGFRWRSFLWELDRFERGRGSSNFAFLLASLNGLACRFLAILCISEYLDRASACDAKINKLLVDKLRVPTDGTWKQLVDVLCNDFGGDARTPLIGRIRRAIRQKYPFPNSRKGIDAVAAMQELVRFRNELLHSTRRIDEEEILLAVERLKILYRSLQFLGNNRLVAIHKMGCWVSEPEQIVFEDNPDQWTKKLWLRESGLRSKPMNGEETFKKEEFCSFGELFWMTEVEEEPAIRCWPFLHLHHWSETDGQDIFFFNGWDNQEAEYISYHDAQPRTNDELSIEWSSIRGFWGNIPVVPVPFDAKIDYLGVADFYRSYFVGREKEMESILGFGLRSSRKYGLVQASPGLGKTALFAVMYHRWRSKHRMWPEHLHPLWHFCSHADGWNHPVVFFRSLLAQMDECMGRQSSHYPKQLEALLLKAKECWRELEEFLPKGHKVLLFIDGLDEAVDSIAGLPSIVSMLPGVDELPESCSVVVSYRWNRLQENQRVVPLLPASVKDCELIEHCAPLGGLSKKDVYALISEHSNQLDVPEKTMQVIWKTVRRVEGDSIHVSPNDGGGADPFVVRFLAEAVSDEMIDLERPETVPQNLDELFDRLWNQLSDENNYFLHRLLGMLAVMPALGHDQMFADVFHHSVPGVWQSEDLTPSLVAERRVSINKLLLFQGDSYRLFHERFRLYVMSRFHPRDLALALHLPLLKFCRFPQTFAKHRSYGQLFKVFHLSTLASHPGLKQEERDEFQQQLWTCLWDDEFFQEKLARWGRIDLIAQDFSYAFQGFKPQHDSDDAWQLFARTFHLTKRAHFVLAKMFEVQQEQLKDVSQKGELEQVNRRILESPTPYRKLWTAALSSHWMKQAGHDAMPKKALLPKEMSNLLRSEELDFLDKLLGKKWLEETQ